MTEAKLNNKFKNEKNNIFFNKKFVIKLKLTDKNKKKKKNNDNNNKKNKKEINNVKKKKK